MAQVLALAWLVASFVGVMELARGLFLLARLLSTCWSARLVPLLRGSFVAGERPAGVH